MQLEEIISVIDAQLLGCNITFDVKHLLTDSRSLVFPENTLFFALKTTSGDGHLYIKDLIYKGLRAFVVEDIQEDLLSENPHVSFLKVGAPLLALQKLSAYHRQEFKVPVVGITGSNGKTIVKEWLYQLLSSNYTVTKSPRSYNSQIGVPLSVWMMNAQTDLGVFEAGISQPAEMEHLARIIQPSIGVITNIGTAHQEFFESELHKCIEKLKLFDTAAYLVYCADDAVVSAALQQSNFRGKHFAWSKEGNSAAVKVTSITTTDDVVIVNYIYEQQNHAFTLPFTDAASIQNAVHCLAVCLILNVSHETIAQGLSALSSVAMRLEVKQGVRGCVLINDSYNSDMNSLDIALDFMSRRFNTSKEHRKVAILSDIEQSGLDPKVLYQQVDELLLRRDVDVLLGVGVQMVRARHLFYNIECHVYEDTADLLRSKEIQKIHDSVVLVKGSRKAGFECVTDFLSFKMHTTTLEVNLEALVQNLRHYRAMLQPNTKMVCMIKASAYGAGAVEVAKTLSDCGVDYLAVAVADEGVALRLAGIKSPIIVMNPEPSAFSTLFAYGLEPEVYSFELFDRLSEFAEMAGVEQFGIHLKFDTGMTRFGFNPESDVPLLIAKLKESSRLQARSAFTHFVGSDHPQFDDFTKGQYERFVQAAEGLQSALPYKILRHICNSAGIERFPQYHLDMVRLGLGLYGISPIDGHLLSPVSTLTTSVLQIHEAPSDATVGYSRKGVLQRNSRIATLPIGYADGLNRHLGCGRGYCLVNGQVAPYVGNICMDVCMIDVTDISCKVGDRVEIFGPTLPVTQLAEWLDTIPYEVLTGISERVKRLYFE